MARIVTVYTAKVKAFVPSDMSYIRWLKISEALANCGHLVDIATNEPAWTKEGTPILMGEDLRRVQLSQIRWKEYDAVKTFFNIGFDTLANYGGKGHPFIISKLGSVVGPLDMDGIYFHGTKRKQLYSNQEQINQTSKYITVLNESAKKLWTKCFGPKNNILVVPGGVDSYVPPPLADPFPNEKRIRCVFAGNVYKKNSQPEANKVLVYKLNQLGKLLSGLGIHLYMIGPGDVKDLDNKYVKYMGILPYDEAWNYFYFAHVGIVVCAGKFMHNNESSKIYHYLRVGLPVVSESGFPNDNIIKESGLGFIVENGDLELMSKRIVEAAHKDWNRNYAINYILNNHTWDKRVEIYDRIIKDNFN